MSEEITVREGDFGRVWVFAIDLDEAEARAFARRNGAWPVQEALGAASLDPEHVEVFPVSDLGEMGLAGYLHEGYGVPEEQLAGLRARLDALRGHVLVLSSRAFRGTTPTSFRPRAPLRLVASFSEAREPVSFAPLPSEAAVGTVAGGAGAPVPPAPPRGWVVVAVVAIALLAIGLLIWART